MDRADQGVPLMCLSRPATFCTCRCTRKTTPGRANLVIQARKIGEYRKVWGNHVFLEHAPRGDEHDTRRLATLLATGCNTRLADMARSAALPYQCLWWMATYYLYDDTLKVANNLLVNEHHRQWLAFYWGDGTFSSSDGQRFAVSGKVRNARALPTYIGTGRGVTMQTHSSDQYAQYGSKVVPATLRDATVVLDEIVDNETDTAGYSDIIFVLFDLLGLFFCPWMCDLADKRLYKIRGQEWTYPDLRFTGTVNPDYCTGSMGGAQTDSAISRIGAASSSFGAGSPACQQSSVLIVVSAILVSASWVRKPWWPVTSTFGCASSRTSNASCSGPWEWSLKKRPFSCSYTSKPR